MFDQGEFSGSTPSSPVSACSHMTQYNSDACGVVSSHKARSLTGSLLPKYLLIKV